MSAVTKLWRVAEPISAEAQAALSAYSALTGQLLFNRNLTNAAQAEAYLNVPDRLPAAYDPDNLLGLPEAADRLQAAIRRGERIAIYGDYDTDGVTATALLVQTLGSLGARVEPYIPDREEEGYGLNVEALRKLQADGVRVVVSVDCGVRSLVEADEARALGLDLIITDHHHPGPELPRAFALVNPKQPGDTYPEQNLAGVGLAYKLAQALVRPLGAQAPINGSDVLDLVALGTVADLAPLSGENRALVRQGLRFINRPRREGLKSLISAARLKPGAIDAGSIGFFLGPRLNAAGRLESALAAYQLLTTGDVFQANQLAQQLEAQNRERQELTRETSDRAREIALAAGPQAHLLFAADPAFRSGIVGLAASRLAEEFYRPAIVANLGPDFTRGSCRSIREFHITEALDECADLLVKHGGHAAAAGFTVATANLDELAARLRAIADRQLGGLELRPELKIDKVVRLDELDMQAARDLQLFEPCGYGNPGPLLAAYDLRVVSARGVGADNAHLKLTVGDGAATMEAIAFRHGHWLAKMPGRVNLAFQLEVNEWNGRQRLQLNVRDLQAG